MNEQEYIKALKKALSGMDRSSRETVVQEIQSHIAESGDLSADDLEQRFGTPEALAQQYMEGQAVKTPIAHKAGRFGKNLLAIMGTIILAIILLIAGLVYWFSGDEFNFADEEAPELTATEHSWKSNVAEGTPNIHVNQARAVFYWHDAPEIRWSCKGRSSPIKDAQGVYQIRHQNCLVYLPKQPVSIIASQGDVVLIRPQSNINLTLNQSQMRIAEKGNPYDYQIESDRSKTDGFSANETASTRITIKAFEAKLSHYQY